jgi:RHS repeat-associated protein
LIVAIDSLPNGIQQSLSYDAASRLTELHYTKADNGTVEKFSYTYDPAGRRISKTTTQDRSNPETPISATYNSANRMQTLSLHPDTAREARFALAYDLNGNLISKTQTHRATSATPVACQTPPCGFDVQPVAANQAQTAHYTWDSRNRLVHLSQTNPSNPTDTTSNAAAHFSYDAQGRRISRTVNNATTHFVYEGQQSLGELRAATTPGQPDSFEPLLTGLQLDEVIARYTNQGDITYLTDALNTVLSQTNVNQDSVTEYAYSAYGESQLTTGASQGNSSTYTAREDDGTGLMFYRARYFDPVMKRFVSEDPMGFDGGNNFYLYAASAPTLYFDPTGNVPSDPRFGITDPGFWKWWENAKYDWGPFDQTHPGFNRDKPFDLPNNEDAKKMFEEYEKEKCKPKPKRGKPRFGRGGGRGQG